MISLLVRAPDSRPLSPKAVGKRKRESDLLTTLVDLSSPTSSTSPSNSIGILKVNIPGDVFNDEDTRPSKRPKVDSLPGKSVNLYSSCNDVSHLTSTKATMAAYNFIAPGQNHR